MRNIAAFIAESLGRVIAAIRVTSIHWWSYLPPNQEDWSSLTLCLLRCGSLLLGKVKFWSFSGSDLLMRMLPTFCPTLWVISFEFCVKPSILEEEHAIEKLSPPKALYFSFSPLLFLGWVVGSFWDCSFSALLGWSWVGFCFCFLQGAWFAIFCSGDRKCAIFQRHRQNHELTNNVVK